MKPRPQIPRWLLAGLVLLSGAYFQMNPVIRFGEPSASDSLTGMEQFANMLLAATVATFAFIALRTISKAMDSRK